MACPKCGCKVHYQHDSGWDGEQQDESLERCAACRHVFHGEDAADDEDEHWRDPDTGRTTPKPRPADPAQALLALGIDGVNPSGETKENDRG